MKVSVEIFEDYFEGDYGNDVAGLTVKCSKCGHFVEINGQGDASAKRGAMMLKEECPEYEDNYYVLPRHYE